jgi:hypothetical protein
LKQSGRAVHAFATRRGAQACQVGWRTHCRCTFDVSTSSRDRGDSQSQILHPVLGNDFSSPKRRDPGWQRLPGSLEECSGDCHLVSPATQANRTNASRFQKRAAVHRRNSRESPRRLSAASAAACQSLLIDDS